MSQCPECGSYTRYEAPADELCPQCVRIEEMKAEIKHLRADNERLQAALETIEKTVAWGYPDRWETTPAEVRQLARRALEGKDG